MEGSLKRAVVSLVAYRGEPEEVFGALGHCFVRIRIKTKLSLSLPLL